MKLLYIVNDQYELFIDTPYVLTFFNLRRHLRLVIEFENHYMHELTIVVVRFILLRLSVRVEL